MKIGVPVLIIVIFESTMLSIGPGVTRRFSPAAGARFGRIWKPASRRFRWEVPAGNWPGPYITRFVNSTLRPPARIVLADEFRMQLLTVTFSQLAPARLSSPV